MNSKISTSSKQRELLVGEVKSCVLSNAGMVGGVNRPTSTARITSTTYMVTVTVDGKDYYASSKTFYEPGQAVIIAVIIGRTAKIVEEQELKEQESLLR